MTRGLEGRCSIRTELRALGARRPHAARAATGKPSRIRCKWVLSSGTGPVGTVWRMGYPRVQLRFPAAKGPRRRVRAAEGEVRRDRQDPVRQLLEDVGDRVRGPFERLAGERRERVHLESYPRRARDQMGRQQRKPGSQREQLQQEQREDRRVELFGRIPVIPAEPETSGLPAVFLRVTPRSGQLRPLVGDSRYPGRPIPHRGRVKARKPGVLRQSSGATSLCTSRISSAEAPSRTRAARRV